VPLPLIPDSHLSAAADPARRLRFMEVVRRRLRERRYSRRTEEAYVYWIRRFIRFHERRHPNDMGEAEVVALFGAVAEYERAPIRQRSGSRDFERKMAGC
jgi:hypothetical protein